MSRNIVITGGNSGIGKEMARALAAGGDHVIIASSKLEKSQAAVDDIRSDNKDAAIEAMTLDLSDFDAIDRFSESLLQRMPVIDVLILNAGLYTNGTRRLDNGLEAMIGIMHFGHFRLVQRLLDAVTNADAGRIVVTSSVAHKMGNIRPETFENPSKHWIAFKGYAQAKLANLLFTRELARRLEDTKVTVNAFHPGAVDTGVWQELPKPIQKMIGMFLISSAQGADTGVWLATAPEAGAYSGDYFVNRKRAHGSSESRDKALASQLWKASEARM